MQYVFVPTQILPHVIRGSVTEGDSTLFQCAGKRGNFHYLRPEVFDWLLTNVGTGNSTFAQYGCYDKVNWYVHKFNQTFLICFRNKTQAMLFKLSWS